MGGVGEGFERLGSVTADLVTAMQKAKSDIDSSFGYTTGAPVVDEVQ